MRKNKELMEGATSELSTDVQDHNVIPMRSGRTTYLINVHFNPDSKETIESKVKKLIRKDVAKGHF